MVLCSTLPTKPAAQPPLSPSPLARHKLLDPKIIASLCLKDLLQADHKMIWPWPFDHMLSTLVQLHTGDTFWPNQLWLTTLDWNSAGPQKSWCPQAWHGLPNAKYKFIPFNPHQAARAPPFMLPWHASKPPSLQRTQQSPLFACSTQCKGLTSSLLISGPAWAVQAT